MSSRKQPSKASLASKLPRFVKLSREAYHADKSAIGRSALWTFHQRRQQYAAEYIEQNNPAKKVTKQMDMGTLAHSGLLEPLKFPTQYAIFPAKVLANVKDKESPDGAESTNAAEKFRAENEAKGLVVLKQKDFDVVARMVESVQRKLGAEGWLDLPAKREQAIYWNEPTTGMLCKTLLDWLIVGPQTAFVFDVKTTGDASPSAFKYRVEDGGLWLQDAHYSEGAAMVTGLPVEFYFVVVETKFPHACSIQKIRQSDRDSAAECRRRIMANLQACLESGDFSEVWEHDITEISVRPSCFAA